MTSSSQTLHDRVTSAEPFISYFIDKHDGITETRLHPLLFYTEATYYEATNQRLTAVEWRTSPDGIYSEDIQLALAWNNTPNVTPTTCLYSGKRTIAYHEPSVSYTIDDPTIEAHLSDVLTESQEFTTTDLIDWTKNQHLFDAAPHFTPIEFPPASE